MWWISKEIKWSWTGLTQTAYFYWPLFEDIQLVERSDPISSLTRNKLIFWWPLERLNAAEIESVVDQGAYPWWPFQQISCQKIVGKLGLGIESLCVIRVRWLSKSVVRCPSPRSAGTFSKCWEFPFLKLGGPIEKKYLHCQHPSTARFMLICSTGRFFCTSLLLLSTFPNWLAVHLNWI